MAKKDKAAKNGKKAEKAPEIPEIPPPLEDIILDNYPLKKFVQLIFLTKTKKSAEIHDNLINFGKNNKENLIFVNKKDVTNWLKAFLKEEPLLVAKIVKPYLTEIAESSRDYFTRREQLPAEILAKAIKAKIIDLMFIEITLKEEEERLEKEKEEERKRQEALENDTLNKGKKGNKDKKEAKPKTEKKEKKEKGDKKNKKEKQVVEPEQEPETEIEFFILTGFNDPDLFTELPKINVPLTGVVEFFQNYPKLCPERSNVFENMSLVQFCPNASKIAENFENFVKVIKEIVQVKKQHLSHTRNLRLYEFKDEHNVIPLENLKIYNEILDDYPYDSITIQVITDSLIEEISTRIEDEEYIQMSSTSICLVPKKPNPCLCKEKAQKHKSIASFQVHEEDQLNIILNSFKLIGREIYDKSFKYLKLIKPLNLETSKSELELLRKYDKYTPLNKEANKLILSDYLHLALFNNLSKKTIINYRWREDLSKSALFQMLFKAQNEFTSFDNVYCEESKSFLLRYYHNFNDFGLCVQEWDQFLQTPICLRDFFKYMYVEEEEKPIELPKEEEELLDEVKSADDNGKKGKGKDKKGKEKKGKGKTVTEIPVEKTESLLRLEKLEREQKLIAELERKRRENLLQDLMNYPKSDRIKEFCGKFEENNNAIAYDLGYRRLQIVGTTTIFQSFDGIQLKMDNSRFLDDEPRFVFNLSTTNSILFIDSEKIEPFTMNFLLSDGAKLLFSKPSRIEEATKEAEVKKKDEIKEAAEEEEEIEPKLINADSKIVEVNLINLPETLADFNEEIEFKEDNIELLQTLEEALEKNKPIYKITPNKKNKMPTNIPVSNIIERILPQKIEAKDQKGFDLIPVEIDEKSYDFRVVFPNKGSILTLPRPGSHLIDVKQIRENGKYRIFSPYGQIIARNLDGSIKIYRPNGDFILLEKPITDIGRKCDKYCDCRNVKFCQEQVRKMFGDSDYATTRLNTEDSSGGLEEFAQAPFLRKSLLKFDGGKVIEEGGEMVKVQSNFVIIENDFLLDEKYFERDDGLKAVLTEEYKVVQFPDGTRITSRFEVEDDLVYVDNCDGWVSVFSVYKLENQKFATITYNGREKLTEIELKNCKIQSYSNEYFNFIMDNTKFKITTKDVKVRKICEKCQEGFHCFININPFYKGLKGDENEFLKAFDSYNKEISFDFRGNYKKNCEFIKGNLNKANCDHSKFIETEKLFIVNEDLSGSQLWSDNMIETRKSEENCEILDYFNKLNKTQTTEILTKSYQKYQNRFLKPILGQIALSNKPKSHSDICFYVTFRILNQIHDLKLGIHELKKFLNMNYGISPVLNEEIQNVIEICIEFETEKEKERNKAEEEQIKKTLENKPLVNVFVPKKNKKEISVSIKEWKDKCNDFKKTIRTKGFDPYFSSEYYKPVS